MRGLCISSQLIFCYVDLCENENENKNESGGDGEGDCS